MLAGARRRRHAGPLMAAALAADVAVTVLLLMVPVSGGIAAAALVSAYSILALAILDGRTSPGTCRCFWKVLNTTTPGGLLARNALLIVLAITVAVGGPEGLTASQIAAGGVVMAAAAGIARLGDRASSSRRPKLVRAGAREAGASE
jgi:hypothetical protein